MIAQLGGVEDELSGCLDASGHGGEAEADRLMLDDRLAKGDTFPGIVEGRVERGLAMPTACAAMPIRPPSRFASAMR